MSHLMYSALVHIQILLQYYTSGVEMWWRMVGQKQKQNKKQLPNINSEVYKLNRNGITNIVARLLSKCSKQMACVCSHHYQVHNSYIHECMLWKAKVFF